MTLSKQILIGNHHQWRFGMLNGIKRFITHHFVIESFRHTSWPAYTKKEKQHQHHPLSAPNHDKNRRPIPYRSARTENSGDEMQKVKKDRLERTCQPFNPNTIRRRRGEPCIQFFNWAWCPNFNNKSVISMQMRKVIILLIFRGVPHQSAFIFRPSMVIIFRLQNVERVRMALRWSFGKTGKIFSR